MSRQPRSENPLLGRSSRKAPDLPFLDPVRASPDERALAHLAASRLLDYPSPQLRASYGLLREVADGMPAEVRDALHDFLDSTVRWPLEEQQAHYVATFDLKRRCALYLTYYTAGDTRRRGMALVTFVEAYKACGFVPRDDELPDYLPSVLELSARTSSGDEAVVAAAVLGAHREGIEVLRSALHHASSPYARLVDAVCLTLPAVDAETAARFAELVAAGPPAEMVGLSAPLLPFPTTRPSEVPA